MSCRTTRKVTIVALMSLGLITSAWSQQPQFYVDPGQYPAGVPFISITPPDGLPMFKVDSLYEPAFEQLATAKNVNRGQLFGAFVLYLYHVKGVQFAPATSQQAVNNTVALIVQGYTDSGLKTLLDAQMAGQPLPPNMPIEAWLNVTRRMTTLQLLGGGQGPNKAVICSVPAEPDFPEWSCKFHWSCPPAFPCFFDCLWPVLDCWDYAEQIGPSNFMQLLTMSLP